ncbi:hypothetical protein MRX96_049745 [Rhipicephalus microplus]
MLWERPRYYLLSSVDSASPAERLSLFSRTCRRLRVGTVLKIWIWGVTENSISLETLSNIRSLSEGVTGFGSEPS